MATPGWAPWGRSPVGSSSCVHDATSIMSNSGVGGALHTAGSVAESGFAPGSPPHASRRKREEVVIVGSVYVVVRRPDSVRCHQRCATSGARSTG